MTTDAANKIIDINPRGTEIFGYPFEEMIGRLAFEFLMPDRRAAAEERVQARRAGKTTESEVSICRCGVSQAWLFSSSQPICDDAKQFAGALYMFTDITERRKAE